MEVVVTTGAITRAKLQIVTTNKQTSSFYRMDALPGAQSTVSEHSRKHNQPVHLNRQSVLLL